MVGCVAHRLTVRQVGLYDHFARRIAPSGPSAYLGQQLKGPLTCTEVGQMDARIGGDDADQGHAREVEPLGHHLRAQQHIGFAATEGTQNSIVCAFAACRVHVHSENPDSVELLDKVLLHALCAHAEQLELGCPAGLARPRNRCGAAAVVADQAPSVRVVGEGHLAVGAGGCGAALRALHEGGVAAPVLKQDHALVPLDPVLDLLPEKRGENRTALPLHIDDGDRRHGTAVDPVRQREQPELAGAGILIRLKGWRGRTQYHGNRLQHPAHHGHVTRPVAWRRIRLLV